jgi:hypothetical protein
VHNHSQPGTTQIDCSTPSSHPWLRKQHSLHYSVSPNSESESVMTSLLFGACGAIWDRADRFARLVVFVRFDDRLLFSLSLSSGALSLVSLDAAGCFFLPEVDRRLGFFPIVCPSSRRFCKSSACTLTSSADILTHRILPDIHLSCRVHMSLRFPMVDGLANVIFAGQLTILTLRAWIMLSS